MTEFPCSAPCETRTVQIRFKNPMDSVQQEYAGCVTCYLRLNDEGPDGRPIFVPVTLEGCAKVELAGERLFPTTVGVFFGDRHWHVSPALLYENPWHHASRFPYWRYAWNVILPVLD